MFSIIHLSFIITFDNAKISDITFIDTPESINQIDKLTITLKDLILPISLINNIVKNKNSELFYNPKQELCIDIDPKSINDDKMNLFLYNTTLGFSTFDSTSNFKYIGFPVNEHYIWFSSGEGINGNIETAFIVSSFTDKLSKREIINHLMGNQNTKISDFRSALNITPIFRFVFKDNPDIVVYKNDEASTYIIAYFDTINIECQKISKSQAMFLITNMSKISVKFALKISVDEYSMYCNVTDNDLLVALVNGCNFDEKSKLCCNHEGSNYFLDCGHLFCNKCYVNTFINSTFGCNNECKSDKTLRSNNKYPKLYYELSSLSIIDLFDTLTVMLSNFISTNTKIINCKIKDCDGILLISNSGKSTCNLCNMYSYCGNCNKDFNLAHKC